MRLFNALVVSVFSILFFANLCLAQSGIPLDPLTLTKYVDKVPKPAKVFTYDPATKTTVPLHIGMFQKRQKLHRDLKPTKVWCYGTSRATATFPGPTLEARRGIPADIKWTNNLPNFHMFQVDETLHWADPPIWPGAGVPTVVHLHGGEVESQSDGHPDAWFTSGFGQKGPE